MLPIFKSMESYRGGDGELRGRGGPLKITDSDESGPLYDSFFEAAESIGITRNPDYNGGEQEGIAMTQASISRRPAHEHGARAISIRRARGATCASRPARMRRKPAVRGHALRRRALRRAGRDSSRRAPRAK